MTFSSTEVLPPSLKVQPDGSLYRNGTRVGRIVNSGREVPQFRDGRFIGDAVVHGWSIHDLDGCEVFWSARWSDSVALAPDALARAERQMEVV